MGKYLLAFWWLFMASTLGLFGLFMAYAYVQHGDTRNIPFVLFSSASAFGFTALFLDCLVKAITRSVYTAKKELISCLPEPKSN